MERERLIDLINRLRDGRRFAIDRKHIDQELKDDLANYIEDNLCDYLDNEEYDSDDDVLYNAIEPIYARDGKWMIDEEDDE